MTPVKYINNFSSISDHQPFFSAGNSIGIIENPHVLICQDTLLQKRVKDNNLARIVLDGVIKMPTTKSRSRTMSSDSQKSRAGAVSPSLCNLNMECDEDGLSEAQKNFYAT